MDTSGFNTKIMELNGQIKELQAQLEAIRKEYLSAANAHIVNWFNEEAESALKSKPERTKSYGTKGLSVLRSDLNNLIASTPNLINQYINIDSNWPHRTLPDTPYHGRRAFEPYGPNVRVVLGYLGPILIKHGFTSAGSGSPWKPITYGSTQLRYESYFDISEEMKQIGKNYNDLYSKLESLNDQLLTTKKDKSDAEVNDLWSKV